MFDRGKVLIIAELSANHGGSYALAKKTIAAMKKAGADAVKLQTYTADTLTLDCDAPPFRIRQGTLWDGRTLYELYREAATPWEWQPKLKRYAEELGMICFSTPFDRSSVDFLRRMRVPAYKIASFEINDIPLIEYVAAQGKPVIISTGVAGITEIRDAVRACRRVGNRDITLLKCTSAYPAPLAEMNLRTIPDLARRFRCPVGLSDHSIGFTAAVAGVALGARIIEKHFILDRRNGGADASFSMEPAEFAALVAAVRETEQALGRINYQITPSVKSSKIFCRSLFVTRDIARGEHLTLHNIRSIRPGNGLLPKYLPDVLGKKARADIVRGTPLTWDLIA